MECVYCEKQIDKDGYYYWIGDNYTALGLENNCYCSQQCILDDLMVDWSPCSEYKDEKEE